MQHKGTIRRSWHPTAIAAAGSLLLCLAAGAQVSAYGDKQMGPVNDKPPALLDGVGIAQRLNQPLPLNLTFTDDAGHQVSLSSYFGKRPAILALVYYRCPMLCSEELDGLTSALEMASCRAASVKLPWFTTVTKVCINTKRSTGISAVNNSSTP